MIITRKAINKVNCYLFDKCMVEDGCAVLCQWTTSNKNSHTTLKKLLYVSVLSRFLKKILEKKT